MNILKRLAYYPLSTLIVTLLAASLLSFSDYDSSPKNESMIDSCKAGPKLIKIHNVSSTYLNGSFYGLNVFQIKWTIKDKQGKTIRTGEVSPQDSNPLITFGELPAGSYTLTYQGKSCTSAPSTLPFSISKNSDPAKNARTSANDPTIVAKGMDEHLELSITRHGDIFQISDLATPPIGNDYEFRYMIGAEVLTSPQPLKNYVVSGTNPIRIWKAKTKKGIKSINQWEDIKNWYYDKNAGEAFSNNTSVAFQTMVFPGIQNPSGFINPIPASYEPWTQVAQWADIAPNMKLPEGHVWIASRGLWSVDQVMSKGVTHIEHHSLPWENMDKVNKMKADGLTYNNVPRAQDFLHLKPSGPEEWVNGYNKQFWPNGPLSKEQAIQKANEADINDIIWIGQTMENVCYMPPEAQMWGDFYKRLRERYEEKWGTQKKKYYIAHNYFMFWPGDLSLSRDKSRAHFKKMLHLPVNELPKTNYSPGGTLSSTNLIPEAIYIGAPDIQQGQVYETIYRMHLIQHMGYESGVFLFGVHEWKPNNLYQYNYPEGTFYSWNKIPLDPNVIITNGFVAQVFGKLYIEWGGPGKTGNKNFDPQWGNGVWYPKGAITPQSNFPYYAKPNTPYYPGYTGSSDLSYFSQKLYNDTFGQVVGGTRKFLKFRIDNGPWISPSQFSAEEIVDAYHDKRGFVFSESKNGKTAWFYLNSFADNNWHDIEVELSPGIVTKKRVAGNGVHVRLLNK